MGLVFYMKDPFGSKAPFIISYRGISGQISFMTKSLKRKWDNFSFMIKKAASIVKAANMNQ